MKTRPWACFHPLLLVLTLVNLVTMSSSAIVASTVVAPVFTVVQTATIVAIPGISSTFTNFGSPSAIIPRPPSPTVPAPPSFSGTLTAPLVFLTSASSEPSTSISLPNLSSTVPGFRLTSTSTTKPSSSSASSTFLTSTTTPSSSSLVTTENPSSTVTPVPSNTSKAPVIAGSTVGGAAALGVLLIGLWYLLKKRKSVQKTASSWIGNNGSRRSRTSDIERGHELRNIRTTPGTTGPTNEREMRPNGPLSTVGTISTFAPTLPPFSPNQTFWPVPPYPTGGNSSTINTKPNIVAAPETPPRPRRSDELHLTDAELLLKRKMEKRAPPTAKNHYPGRQLTPAAQAVLDRNRSPKPPRWFSKPAGARWEVIRQIQEYGTYSPYDEDSNDVTQLPYPTSDRDLSPEPLNVVKMSSRKKEVSDPYTPTRPPTRGKAFSRTPRGKMATDLYSDESDDDTKEKARTDALAALEGNSPYLTTDRAMRRELIGVQRPPQPIFKNPSYGKPLGHRRVSSTGNLNVPKPEMSNLSPSGPLTRQISRPLGGITSFYSRKSNGEPFSDSLDDVNFEEYRHNEGRRMANSTELGHLNDGRMPHSYEVQKRH
ncbi:hypothetical protein HYALB_00012116 [Hymenoscyphus albidus]|uniref:Uncharacterized protein n=1 Tax=Hymenoscyphus albidus TaxID=595503 RepID=A0A9N9LIK5_9HELO|nr:hypothetical protein HYALB_00012116 [Hymenoscyphus albidus]